MFFASIKEKYELLQKVKKVKQVIAFYNEYKEPVRVFFSRIKAFFTNCTSKKTILEQMESSIPEEPFITTKPIRSEVAKYSGVSGYGNDPDCLYPETQGENDFCTMGACKQCPAFKKGKDEPATVKTESKPL